MQLKTRPHTLAFLLLPLTAVQEEGFGPRVTHLPEEEVVIPIDVSTGHAIVEVKIDGLGPFPLILDTAASGSVLDHDLAEELGLPVVGSTSGGDPSNPTALQMDLVVMPLVELGAARFEEITAASWNRPLAAQRGNTRGILGLPTFEDCLFTLDYPKGELRLSRGTLPESNEDPEVVAFHRRDNGLISVPLGLPGGLSIDAHFDSGNQSSVFVPASFESKLSLVEGSRRTGRGMRASGPVEFVVARLRGDVTVGPWTLRDPEIRFDERLPHANIGRTFLEDTEVTVDLASERMRIRPSRADNASEGASTAGPQRRIRPAHGARRSLGIGLAPYGAEANISLVMPNSPAQRAGIEVGDILVEVDGKPVSAGNHGPLREAVAGTAAISLTVRRGDETKSFEIPALPNHETPTTEEGWSQWRGPNRDGRVPKSQAPAEWGDAVERAWTAEVGSGHSSPVVGQGNVYTLTRQGDSEVVTAVELATGKVSWRSEYPVEIGINPYAKGHGRWPRSTPLVAQGRLFTLGADGTLSAWNATDGKLLWRHAIEGGVDTSQLFCGTSMSPIHDTGRLFVHVGDDSGGALIAYAADDGKEIWRTELEGPGYASPVRLEIGGIAQLVTLTMSSVVAVALEDGELLWRAPFEDEWNENIVTPIVHGEEVIVAGVRSGMRSLRPIPPGSETEPEPSTDWQVETKWINRRAGLYMSSPIVDGDTLYGFSKERRGQLIAVSLADGSLLWTSQEAADNAALILAGERLVVLTTEGDLVVGKCTPTGWAAEQRYEVASSATWAHPVLLPDGFLVKGAAELIRWRNSPSGE